MPSTWPRASTRQRLRVDRPIDRELQARGAGVQNEHVVVHRRAPLRRRLRRAPARVRREHRDRAARDPRAHAVRAAREDDRYARAEHAGPRCRRSRGSSAASRGCCRPRDPARAGCRDRRRPRTSMPLIRAASLLIALSNASGPSSRPPVICPRSAILQSAAASIVAGIFEVTVSTAARIATFGCLDAQRRARGRSRSGRCRPCPRASARC